MSISRAEDDDEFCQTAATVRTSMALQNKPSDLLVRTISDRKERNEEKEKHR